MHISIHDIESLLNAPIDCNISFIERIYFDTRKIIDSKNSLFLDFARNERQSLTNINDAIEKEISLVITSFHHEDLENKNVLIVSDVLAFLQNLAEKHRKNHDTYVIGITGSNGKTILKEWISTLLTDQNIYKSPGSYNSQIGVPLSILGIEASTDYAIIEAGISTRDEMKNLEPIVSPDFGILTNIGDAHDAGFLNKEEKLKEKLILFRNSKAILFHQTDFLTKERLKEHLNADLISWSFVNKEADYFVEKIIKDDNVSLRLSGKSNSTYSFLLKDKVSIYNILFAIISLHELNINTDLIQKYLLLISSISMRLELVEGRNNCLLINDTYNADLTSLEGALDFAKTQKYKRKTHLVLAPFEELKDDYIRKINSIIKSFQIDHITCIGENLFNDNSISVDTQFFKTSDQLNNHWKQSPPNNEIIVFKGAHRFKLDQLIQSRTKLVHKTKLNINLHNLQHNLQTYRNILHKDTLVMAVIKAGAYGSDSITLGKYLANLGVNYLAVAYLDEGIELRNAGIDTPIMVMNPDLEEIDRMLDNRLEPEIYSIYQLQLLSAHPLASQCAIHLKFDTGMNRLGMMYEELDEVIQLIQSNHLNIKSVFTHFHSAEDKVADGLSQEQFDRFTAIYSKLETELDCVFLKHCCNTSAISRFPQYHLDMVRIGVGLYGVSGDKSFERFLLDVHTWHSYISQVKWVDIGEGIGYNHRYISNKKLKVAVVNVGYADGLPRLLSTKNFQLYIDDIPVPIVGMISMDTCVVDVSHLEEVYPGMQVDIANMKQQTFKEVAYMAEMIPYELLCQVGQRVKRVYYKE